MRWRNKRRSNNIEDRRHNRRPTRGLKIGGIGTLLMMALFFFMGQNPLKVLSLNNANPVESSNPQQTDTNKAFASVILASTEDAWNTIFTQSGLSYESPKMVLFTNSVSSRCGMTSSATGPFYCPADHKVYIDLGFFKELDALGAKGEFARAYVIAHEVGHHVQNLLGISKRSQAMQRRVSQKQANQISVLTELQADCFAGIWINTYEKQQSLIQAGDIEDGLHAAESIGDDRLQRQAGQYVNPDSFTHGSSRQRKEWFLKGMRYGDVKYCNTFKEAGL